MRFITRRALIRLAALGIVAGGLGIWAWQRMIRMPLQSFRGPLPPLSAEETALKAALERDVRAFAGQIGERNLSLPARLREAADQIESAFARVGGEVKRFPYVVRGERCDNLELTIPGRSRGGEIVIAGAHYDSVIGSPGANDNGSGVAALLALARAFARAEPARTVRFVAFVNEEPPWFQTRRMGSLVYARRCRERNDNIVAMLSLETIGYYSDEPGSQKYPPPVGFFYPSVGNFIGFVGNLGSAALVRRCVESFRRQVRFPSQGAALPGLIPGVGWSDHWAFWQAGYPAVMVTDTAPFRYPYYHTELDTPEKLDYERLARVVAGLNKVLLELANP
jgi:hypothetical protein